MRPPTTLQSSKSTRIISKFELAAFTQLDPSAGRRCQRGAPEFCFTHKTNENQTKCKIKNFQTCKIIKKNIVKWSTIVCLLFSTCQLNVTLTHKTNEILTKLVVSTICKMYRIQLLHIKPMKYQQHCYYETSQHTNIFKIDKDYKQIWTGCIHPTWPIRRKALPARSTGFLFYT